MCAPSQRTSRGPLFHTVLARTAVGHWWPAVRRVGSGGGRWRPGGGARVKGTRWGHGHHTGYTTVIDERRNGHVGVACKLSEAADVQRSRDRARSLRAASARRHETSHALQAKVNVTAGGAAWGSGWVASAGARRTARVGEWVAPNPPALLGGELREGQTGTPDVSSTASALHPPNPFLQTSFVCPRLHGVPAARGAPNAAACLLAAGTHATCMFSTPLELPVLHRCVRFTCGESGGCAQC